MATIVWTGVEHGRSLDRDVRRGAVRDVESLALIQTTVVESVHQMLTTVSSLPEFRIGDLEAQEQILQDVLARNPKYVNISRTDEKGVVVVSGRLDAEIDLSHRRHVRMALDGAGFVAGEFVQAVVDDEYSFPFAISIRDPSGDVTGALTAVYFLDAYNDFVDIIKKLEYSVVSIADHRGIRIFSSRESDQASVVGVAVDRGKWKAIRSGTDHGTITYSDTNDVDWFLAYRKLRLTSTEAPYLYLFSGIPEAVVRRPAVLTLKRNVGLLLVAAIMSIVIALALNRRFIGSKLRALQNTVMRIQSEEYSTRVGPIGTPREIGVVADAIDGMAQALEQRMFEQQQHKQAMAQALDEKNDLLREVHHRVKNNMQLILSIISLERNSGSDQEPLSDRIDARIRTMSAVHEVLYEAQALSAIEIPKLLKRVADLCMFGNPTVPISVAAVPCWVKLDRAVSLALATNEIISTLVRISQGFEPRSPVELKLERNGDHALLVAHIADSPNGGRPKVGVDDSVKMLLVDALVQQLHGEISTLNEAGTIAIGITFEVEWNGGTF